LQQPHRHDIVRCTNWLQTYEFVNKLFSPNQQELTRYYDVHIQRQASQQYINGLAASKVACIIVYWNFRIHKHAYG